MSDAGPWQELEYTRPLTAITCTTKAESEEYCEGTTEWYAAKWERQGRGDRVGKIGDPQSWDVELHWRED